MQNPTHISMTPARFFFAFLLAAVLFFTLPGAADAEPAAGEEWRVHLGLMHVDPDMGFDTDEGGRVEAGTDQGFRLGFSRRLSRRFSFAMEVGSASSELSVSFDANGNFVRLVDDLDYLPITLGFDYHLTPDKKFDLFLGGRVAHIGYGDIVLAEPSLGLQRFDADDDLGWSLLLGFDRPIADGPWSLHAVLGHVDAGVELTNTEDGEDAHLELDPAFFSIGIGYRF